MESWPVHDGPVVVTHEDVRTHLERTRTLMDTHDLDALVVTSADPYLNEYTPAADNHRFFLSGFTGSTALMLVPRSGRARLLVDGRYHLQADLEVDATQIEVVKVQLSTLLSSALVDQVRTFKRVGFEGDRVSKSLADLISQAAEVVVPLDGGELAEILPQTHATPRKPLHFIAPEISGRTPREKLTAVFKTFREPERTVLLLAALDDIAWLTDGRGYHFAYQSSFAARGFAIHDAVHIVAHPDVVASAAADAPEGVHFHREPIEDVLSSATFADRTTLAFDPSQVTPAYVRRAVSKRGDLRLHSQQNPVIAVRAVKTAAELAHLEACNVRSSRAVSKTIRWVRHELAAGRRVSEAGFYEAANGHYAAEGARDLSFHTIAAVGANTAIIHFSSPSAEISAKHGDLMLLDSGGLYEGGFATDITRSFLAAGRRSKAEPRQREIHTLVLKALLRGMMAVFPEGTRGAFLDSVVRSPLYDAGYDYGHGTGHGVGIHVHEPGISLGPTSTLPIRAGQVSSIEPGIYIPGFGGVRLENVVVYEPHPHRAGFLRSRPLNFTGLDENLVDRDRLDDREREAYDAYQVECARHGTLDCEA